MPCVTRSPGRTCSGPPSTATIGRLTQVCDRWIYTACLCFGLDLAEQARSGFTYGYSVYQAEYSRKAEGSRTVQGTGVGGASMRATVAPSGQWVRLAVTASGFPRGARCRLMVVAVDGQREQAGSWTVPAAGGPEGGVSVSGSAAVPMSQVRAVAVETDAGQELIYLQV